ncbi:MAG: hypothetical protein CMO81_06285 [Waddliaceae bacterium]|nr:hypothetical protein [Waddliaceae bacterium]
MNPFFKKVSFSILGFIFLCSSCSHKKQKSDLSFNIPNKFSNSGKESIPDKWWEAFEDEKLNSIIEIALDDNFSLKSYWERLEAAKATVKIVKSDLRPDLYFQTNAQYRNSSGDDPSKEIQLSLETAYEIDLWGRLNSLKKAETLRAESFFADYQAAALSLSAEIARLWYQHIEAQEQTLTLDQQIELNTHFLRLLEIRLHSGLISVTDVLRQKQLIQNSQQQLLLEEQKKQLLEYQLAILMGKAPNSINIHYSNKLPSLFPLPETGIPAELIQRRPDIRKTWLSFKAANEEVAAAISNRYPRINLIGGISTEGGSSSDLFRDWALSILGSLITPIIDGGERKAKIKQAHAIEKELFNNYAQITLEAFAEVESAITEEYTENQQLEKISTRLNLSKQTYEQLKYEYNNGVSDYLPVLTALRELQELQRNFIFSKRNLIEKRISLYRALAGAFKTPREEKDESI